MTPIIEVSPEQFARTNKGLVHLLQTINDYGERGVSTRALYAEIRMTGYGDSLLDRAQAEGYVKRVPKPPEKKGAWLVVNYLTPKGKKLLEQLKPVTIWHSLE